MQLTPLRVPEILPFLKRRSGSIVIPIYMMAAQLMGNPLGGSHQYQAIIEYQLDLVISSLITLCIL